MSLPDPPAKGNILLVANWESGVGYAWWLMENFWAAIAHRYHPAGAKIFLIYPKIDVIPEAIAAAPITVSEGPFETLDAGQARALLHFVREHDIRNVYLTDSPAMRPLYYHLRRAGVRQIVIHDHTPGDRPRTTGVRRLLKRIRNSLPWTRADYFVGVTPFIRGRMIENANLPPSRCGFATNGIVPIAADESTTDVRSEFGLPDDSIVVVTTGRAHRYKGIDFLVELAHRIVEVEGRRRVHFVFCGDGPHQDEFKALAGQLGLGAHFTFAGRRSDVRALLGSCDIGIQASLGEVGYSLSILEYMSAGLPTLVPNLPSTAGATDHGRTGLVYESRDLDDAAARLLELLDDPELARRIGEAARRSVSDDYRLSNTNRLLLEILDRRFR